MDVVIIGAGLAAAKAAEALRERDPTVAITILGEEPDPPYERPPLSKDFLRGESERAKLDALDPGFYDRDGVTLRTSVRVAAIDTAARAVSLEDGERIAYERLLLATGAAPRRLDVPGADLEGVFTFRTVADSTLLGERLATAQRLVVIGGGWIGCEVAASARQMGAEVTILERDPLPLQRVLGPEMGAVFRDLHVDHGVEFVPEAGVARLEGGGGVERVVLEDGRAFDCSTVVVGIGVVPRTELAEAAGIAVDNGVLVDARLESSAAGVYAAGDVANAEHPFFRERVRIEHWANALNQGPAAAASMLGAGEDYDRLPYFFTDQFDLGMEYTGHAPTWDRVVTRGDVAGREFIAFYLRDGRVVAGMNVNVWDVGDPIKELIRSRVRIDPALLADEGTPIEELPARAA
jgi:3-phenylpropionate/trans-cinnamate dioxygenase ferredoxin reductase component